MTKNVSLVFKLAFCLIVVGSAAIVGNTQTEQSRENRDWEQRERDRRREDRETENRIRNLRILGDTRGVGGQRVTPGPSFVSESRLTAEQKELLKPASHHRVTFASFLSQPNTGLIRLLPREKYDHTIQMPLRGGGAFYSFSKLSQEASEWSDIKFQDSEFHAGFNLPALGLMTMLGDVPLEKVDLDNPAVKFVSQLSLPTKYAEYESYVDKYRAGFEAERNTYQSTLPAQINTTYVLRSTIFKKADAVIAFRVLGVDPDGSLTMLWKIVNRLEVKKI